MDSFNIFEGGDSTARSWFLLNNGYYPLMLCTLYVVGVKYVGPSFMKNRKAFDLRAVMVLYNFIIVLIYTVAASFALYLLMLPENSRFLCKKMVIIEGTHTYQLASIAWVGYVLKYVEFMDTVFFVLRKKNHLITNLHVIHHGSLPLMIWCVGRTETYAFQGIPLLVNSIVHIIMYTYYGLAAMGPSVRKHLWWKKYLTVLQMSQFVLILIIIGIIGPLLGCQITIVSVVIDVIVAVMFFSLFLNFYRKTFIEQNRNGIKKES